MYLSTTWSNRDEDLPFGTINPPSTKTISSPADPKVLAIIISRDIEAIARKSPSAIWCIAKSKNM